MEEATCPLCGIAATRDRLKSPKGYYYTCADCGGFEIGTGALNRAGQGELHPQIHDDVRALTAQGKVPRIEFEGVSGRFTVIKDVRKP